MNRSRVRFPPVAFSNSFITSVSKNHVCTNIKRVQTFYKHQLNWDCTCLYDLSKSNIDEGIVSFLNELLVFGPLRICFFRGYTDLNFYVNNTAFFKSISFHFKANNSPRLNLLTSLSKTWIGE